MHEKIIKSQVNISTSSKRFLMLLIVTILLVGVVVFFIYTKLYVEITPKTMVDVRDIIDSIPKDSTQLTVFGPKSPSNDALRALEKELNALTSDGHYVSFVMVDIKTKSGVAFYSARVMCTQSTIKAVYIGSLLDSDPSLFIKNEKLIQRAITLSDNDAYTSLRETYDNTCLKEWCRKCGVDISFADKLYPCQSVREMCKLWTQMYLFLNNKRTPDELRKYFANSICSAAKDILGEKCLVHSKAGWEDGLDEDTDYVPNMSYPERYTDKNPYNDECAINDTGIVYTKKGPYIFAIFTDWPYGIYRNYTPPNPLNGITQALYILQQSF